MAVTAVKGMGGVGKTTLAWYYFAGAGDRYPGGRWWVSVPTGVVTTVVDYGRRMGVTELPDFAQAAQLVQWSYEEWNRRHPGRKLLVLDDVDDYARLQPYLPHSSEFQVLLTTRVRLEEAGLLRRLDLDELQPLDAFKLLMQLSQAESRIAVAQTTAAALCEWLGYLPLAIELVASFLKLEPDWSLEKLWTRLQAERLAQDALTPVAAAFDLSWRQLTATEQQLAGLLSLFGLAPILWHLVVAVVQRCEVLPPKLSLLQRLLIWRKRPLAPEQWCLLLAEQPRERARRRLVELSLLMRVAEERYQVHPLIRQFLADKLTHMPEAAELQQVFFEVMCAEAARSKERPQQSLLEETTAVLPHLKAAVERCELPGQEANVARGLSWLGELYRAQGRYAESKPLLVRSLTIREQQLGADHPAIATSLNNLAGLYYSQGRYAEAEPLYCRALAILFNRLGEDHPNTQTVCQNFYTFLASVVEAGRAEELSDHPITQAALRQMREGNG